MRLVTWIYALLALSLCAWLFFHWHAAAVADPQTLLDDARSAMSGPEVDYKRARTQLEQALSAAEAGRDQALIEQVLLTRAQLLKRTGGFAQARSDLERILTHYRPGSLAVESLLASVDLQAGEVEPALARATAIISKDRSQSEAWGVRAEALVRLGERYMASAHEKAGFALADAGLERADKLMRRVGVLDAADPRRARSIDELSASFPSSEKQRAREVLDTLDDASRMFSQVPEAIAESMRGLLQRDAALAYLHVLVDAGEVDSAIDFGLGVVRVPLLANYPPFLRDLMKVLADAGRVEAASELVKPEVGRAAAPDAAFFLVWCDVLYRAKKWRDLIPAALLLRASGDPDERAISNFYLGIGQAKTGQDDQALRSLRQYVEKFAVEPFPGSVAIAWDTLAEVHRRREEPDMELSALKRRLELSKETNPGVGDSWLRASELTLTVPPPAPYIAHQQLTQALRLLPKRRAEIEPRWRTLGESLLQSAHIDLDGEAKDFIAKGLTLPEGPRSAFELVRMAEHLNELENYSAALVVAQRTLEQFPDLPPAMDALAAAYRGSGDPTSAAEVVRRELELGSCDSALLQPLLDKSPPELLERWGVDLVSLDPEGIGRRWAAEHLKEHGEVGEAIAGLQRVPPQRLGDQGRILLAQLLYEQGHGDRAQEQLSKLTADVSVLAKALPLMLNIGVEQRDAAHVAHLNELLESRAEVDDKELLGCVDHMLRVGMVPSARKLIETLDTRPKWRGTGLYVRLAQVELLDAHLDAAAEALERALPYDEEGAAALGFVLLAVEQREWNALPARTSDLIATGLDTTPMQYVALAALGERVDEARAAAAKADRDASDEALWDLIDSALAALGADARASGSDDKALVREHGFGVASGGGVLRDPRPLLARIVAIAHPQWAAWAIADLTRQAPPKPGALWPTYLAARGQAWFEDTRSSEQAARSIVAVWPAFVPGWDLIEHAISEEVRKPDHPRLLRLYEQRRKALGKDAPESAEDWMIEARIAEQKGEFDAALAALDRVLGLEPERGAAWRKRGQILRRRREWAGAIDAFHRSLAKSKDESDSHPVQEFLELLEQTWQADRATFESSVRNELDYLAAQFPADPAIALVRARLACSGPAASGVHELERARSILDEFRSRNDEDALDDLRDGSANAWIDFCLEIDPERAYQLAKSELVRLPASIGLWRKLSQVAAQTDRLDEAIMAGETAVRMLPDPDTASALALLAARRGDPIEAVRARVEEAKLFSTDPAGDRRLALATARALLQGNRASLGEAIGVLAKLWSTRDAVARAEEYAEVGSLYGLALCRRGDPGDRTTARDVLLDVAPRVRDATQRNLLSAMASMARYIG